MSDFLSHLAAKHLNLAPIIQPRPLSLFESAAPHTSPGLGPRLDHEALDLSETIESYAPRATSRAPRQPLAANANPIDPHTRSGEDATLLQRSPLTAPAPMEHPSITPPLPERRHEVQREIVNVTNIRQVIEQPIGPAPSAERIIIHQETVIPDRATPPIGLEMIAPQPERETPAPITPRPIVTPVIERIIREREHDAPSQPQPRSTAAAPHLPPPAAIETSTINVTIGRIEVRATPATSAKRATPSPSTLSLDDYLRARDGGKR